MSVIRVLLADDQALVRRGLRLLIDGFDDLTVVAEADDGEAVFTRLLEHDVDVLLCDIRMPRLDGIGVVQRLRGGANKLPVVLLTTFHDEALLKGATRAGANAFLLKDAEPDELRAAVVAAYRGERWIQPQTTGGIAARLADDIATEPIEALDSRELAVLRLLAGGLSNRDIAEHLHLAEGTIKNRVSVILAKLQARDRTQAVLTAIRLGLI